MGLDIGRKSTYLWVLIISSYCFNFSYMLKTPPWHCTLKLKTGEDDLNTIHV